MEEWGFRRTVDTERGFDWVHPGLALDWLDRSDGIHQLLKVGFQIKSASVDQSTDSDRSSSGAEVDRHHSLPVLIGEDQLCVAVGGTGQHLILDRAETAEKEFGLPGCGGHGPRRQEMKLKNCLAARCFDEGATLRCQRDQPILRIVKGVAHPCMGEDLVSGRTIRCPQLGLRCGRAATVAETAPLGHFGVAVLANGL